MNNITFENIKSNQLFDEYYKFLIEENEKYNLTAIKEKDEVFYKHFLDCAKVL